MTKIEKVRQYAEITGMGDGMSTMLRNFMAQFVPALAKVGDLSEKETGELTARFDAQILLSMPGFVSACTQALADVWTDEIADYQLEQCQHPLAKATKDAHVVFMAKTKEIGEAWAAQLVSQVKLED
jgi:hypothetical protein